MIKLTYNSFHEPLLPIGTMLMYKNVMVKIVEYDGYHDGFADYYVIQPVDLFLLTDNYVFKPVHESPYYQRIVRYDDEHLEVLK